MHQCYDGLEPCSTEVNINANKEERRMNEMQRNLLIAVVAIIFAMLLYPPYRVMGMNGFVSESGYAWLIDLPARSTIDIGALLIQWVGVLAPTEN